MRGGERPGNQGKRCGCELPFLFQKESHEPVMDREAFVTIGEGGGTACNNEYFVYGTVALEMRIEVKFTSRNSTTFPRDL